jgi:hypothetical protein
VGDGEGPPAANNLFVVVDVAVGVVLGRDGLQHAVGQIRRGAHSHEPMQDSPLTVHAVSVRDAGDEPLAGGVTTVLIPRAVAGARLRDALEEGSATAIAMSSQAALCSHRTMSSSDSPSGMDCTLSMRWRLTAASTGPAQAARLW